MALFGFGKKNNQQPVSQKPAQKTDPLDDMPFIIKDGIMQPNPNYKGADTPETAPAPSTPARKAWSEDVSTFLARNPEARLVKLVGKPEDLAFYDVGNRCHVEEDDDVDGRYNVTCGGDIIGHLPASIITYAEKNDCPPEDLAVIIAEVEYDVDKDRDIISVYLSV